MKRFKKVSMLFLLVLLVNMMVMPISVNAAAKLNKKSITLNVKKKYTLKASGTSGKIVWTSSNKKVATVSSKGVVKALKKGKTVITAKYGKKKLTCKVTVKQPVTSIKLNKTSAMLNKGKSLTLKATVLPGNANNKSVTWSSSNEKVATVSSKGVVKAVGNGKAVIVVKVKDGSGKKASCKITVSTSSAPSKPNLPENNETIITTPEQLFSIEKIYDNAKIYKLGKDINLGAYSKKMSEFYGILDGNGHKIINLKQPLCGSNYGTIKNIIFDSCNIAGENSEICAVANNNYGTIEKCVIRGKIYLSGGGKAAGIVNDNNGLIKNCTNYAQIMGNAHYNDILGNVQSRNLEVAGICNDNHISTEGKGIDSCTNYGEIKGSQYVGGIVDYNWFGLTNHCINHGTVIDDGDGGYIGGIAAFNWFGKIYNCLNTGTVNGQSGIAGCNWINESIIQNCVNIGKSRYGISETSLDAYIVDCYYLRSASEFGAPENKYTRFKAIENNELSVPSAYPTLDFAKDWIMGDKYPMPRQ